MRLLLRLSVATLLIALSLTDAPSADVRDDWAYHRAQRPTVPEIRNPKSEIRNNIECSKNKCSKQTGFEHFSCFLIEFVSDFDVRPSNFQLTAAGCMNSMVVPSGSRT